MSSNGANGRLRWAALIITVMLAMMAYAVQWGVISARLDGVEKRLDELITETRANRTVYSDLDRRVSRLEGRIDQ